jgi:glutaredoxin
MSDTGTARPSRRALAGLAVLVLAVAAANSWWTGRHDQRLGRQVAGLVQPGDIQMLSSDTCAICTVARRWLAEHRVPFTECSIERDPVCRATFEATHAAGTPVLLVRGQPHLGFQPSHLLRLLQADAR